MFERNLIPYVLILSIHLHPLPISASKPLNVAVSGITNTQAVLSYLAPNSSPCTVAVSPSSTLSPLVYDVDSTKFPGANQDSRAPLGGGSTRQFVVGARTAQRAADNNLYSRALQQDTTYYYEVTCHGAAPATGKFTTATIAIGNSYADPLPVDPTHPGEYAWPTLSLTDRTQQIIDPQTGLLIRRMSLPQDRNLTTNNAAFVNVRTTGWSNASAALSNTDNAAATITGDNTSALLLLPQNNQTYVGYINGFSGSREFNTAFLNWFQVTLNAKTSRTSCPQSQSGDCNIQVCLTIDGVNCNPNGQTFSQPLSTSYANYNFGTTGTAIDLWQSAGHRPFNGTEIAIRQGNVTCDGSSTVTWSSGDYFATFWTAGSTVTINGVNYAVKQVNNTQSLQLQTSCPSTSGQSTPYNGMNFGVLVRKQTTSGDTVSVQYASVNYQNGVFPFFDFTGEYDLCSIPAVTGPSGHPGYNCSMYQNGQVFWIDGTTGESHLIALNQGVFGNQYTGACGTFDSIIFDAANPDIWYCGGTYPEKVQYFGNHSEPMNTTYPGHLEEQVNIPNCNSPTSPSNEPCLAFTNLSGSKTIGSLIQAFDPTFDPVGFSQPYLSHVENGVLVYRFWRSNYGTLGWTVLFDPNATSNGQPNNAGCVGGGAPGCVVGAAASWKSPNARWCALKSNDPMNQPGWMAMGGYGWGSIGSGVAGAGPYLSTVNDGTAFSITTNAAGGPGRCPTNTLNVTGNQCTTVTVDGQPYNPAPCTASAAACGGEVESGAPGAIGNVAVGDYFLLSNSEIMRLIAIGGPGNTKWTFQRAYNNILSSSSANPQLVTACNTNPEPSNVNGSGEWYWNYTSDPHATDANTSTVVDDANGVNAHFFIEGGAMVNSYTLDPRCGAPSLVCYQDRLFSSVPQLVGEGPATVQTTNPAFNGVTPTAFGNWTQSHPAGPGWAPSSQNATFFYDGRPFNGGPLSGSGTANGSTPATLVSGTLWKFPAASVPAMHRKLQATLALSGYKTLLDVSSPAQGNTITGNASDNYKYCIANAPNECVSGSATGDVYVNAPFVKYPYCYFPGQATSLENEFDLCIGDNGMIYDSMTQMNGGVLDPTGTNERVLTRGLARARIADVFWHPHAIANSNWIYFKTSYADDVGDMILAAQVPRPITDGVNRLQFEPLVETVTSAPSGAATAYVEFGYGENGAPANLYCTSRAEVCAAAGSGINLSNPFFFEQTEGSKIAPVACSASCSVTLPVLPQHVVYYRWVFLNSGGAVLARSGTYAAAIN